LTSDIPWDFIFSFVAAVGSGATAAGFILIWNQTRLTKKQISQTQQEIDSTLRPWIGHTDAKFSPQKVLLSEPPKDAVKFMLRNYGRLPAKLSGMAYVWKVEDVRESDLTNLPLGAVNSEMYFPDQENSLVVIGDNSYMTRQTDFFFGLRLDYDYQVGQGKKQGEYGVIFKVVFKSGYGFSSSIMNTWTK